MLWPCTIYTWPLMSAKMWCPCGQLTGILTPVNCIVPLGFLPWGIQVAFPGESKLWQSHATQPTVYAGCFSVSIIHQTLTWTAGSWTCAQVLMQVIAHGVFRHCERVCTERLSLGWKSCHTEESNLHQRHANPTLYQLSYTPILLPLLRFDSFSSWPASPYSLFILCCSFLLFLFLLLRLLCWLIHLLFFLWISCEFPPQQ